MRKAVTCGRRELLNQFIHESIKDGYGLRYERPTRRSDCENIPRPCPFVGCRFNLFLDVTPSTGSIKFNFPDIEPGDMIESCALDIADCGGVTLVTVGDAMNIERERIRQIEFNALLKMRRALKRMESDDAKRCNIKTE
jgi:hypothetical protein